MIFNVTPSTIAHSRLLQCYSDYWIQERLELSPGRLCEMKLRSQDLGTSGLFLDPFQDANDVGAKAPQGLTDGSNGNAHQVYPDISIK